MPCSHSSPDPTSSSRPDTPVIDAALTSALDRVSSLVSRLLGASIATFVLTRDGRYVTASNVGMGDGFSDFPLPLDGSLCQHVVTANARFVTNESELATTFPSLDFGTSYAGTRIVDQDGITLGAFCAFDGAPRVWSISDLAILSDFAALVSDHLTFDDARR